MKSYLFSILAILASAIPGVSMAWLAMTALGLEGAVLALATVATAMLLSVAIFALLVAIGRLFKLVK